MRKELFEWDAKSGRYGLSAGAALAANALSTGAFVEPRVFGDASQGKAAAVQFRDDCRSIPGDCLLCHPMLLAASADRLRQITTDVMTSVQTFLSKGKTKLSEVVDKLGTPLDAARNWEFC